MVGRLPSTFGRITDPLSDALRSRRGAGAHDDLSSSEQQALGRVLAAGAALWWAGPFFGLIDLTVPFPADQESEFFPYYVLETGWGVLFSIVVACPLVALAVRPGQTALVPQQILVAMAIAIPALITVEVGQLLPAFLILGVATVLCRLFDLWPPAIRVAGLPRRVRWMPAIAVAVAVPFALRYSCLGREGTLLTTSPWV
jgi:hypothetical protein